MRKVVEGHRFVMLAEEALGFLSDSEGPDTLLGCIFALHKPDDAELLLRVEMWHCTRGKVVHAEGGV